MSETDVVLLEVEDQVATLRLNRPKVNAINSEIQVALRELSREVTERKDIRAVVLYGGERAFAAGVDIKEMADMSYTDMVDKAWEIQKCFRAVADIPKPTVAAITGYALGGGCELTMCCDFRIAATNAILGQPEVLLGVIPGGGGTQRLPRLVGPARAKELLFSGRQVKADEALRIGLVDEVVEPDQVYPRALEMMKQYAAMPPYAIRAMKEAVDSGMGMDLNSGLEMESRMFAGVFATQDKQTGMRSFIENGPGKAVFEGR